MTRRACALLFCFAVATPAAFAADLSFTSGIDVAADCNAVWENLTEFGRLQKLVPHLHGTANVARATKLGDALFYELETSEGKKNTGKLVVTSLEPAYKLQVIVQPDEGPWLRVQEFTLLTPPAKGKKDGARCRVDYEESFNELAMKHKGYDTSGMVRDLRESYMGTILRRLKNLSEGRDAGPADESGKLREVAKNFP
jgi:hypothetical protein